MSFYLGDRVVVSDPDAVYFGEPGIVVQNVGLDYPVSVLLDDHRMSHPIGIGYREDEIMLQHPGGSRALWVPKEDFKYWKEVLDGFYQDKLSRS